MTNLFQEAYHTKIPKVKDESRPVWTIIIPTHNCASYLSKTLDSVLSQFWTKETMEILVVDDFSTQDNPADVVKQYDDRVRFFQQSQNVGKSLNYATGLKLSKGKYIHILHGDDFVEDGFYNKMTFLFDTYPTAAAAFCHCLYVNENGNTIGETKKIQTKDGLLPNFMETIAVWQKIQPPSITFKREVYEELGGYDLRLKYIEDWEFYVRASLKFEFAYTPETLSNYRIFPQNSSSKSMKGGKRVKTVEKVLEIMDDYIPLNMKHRIIEKRNKATAIYLLSFVPKLISWRDVKGFFVVSKSFFKYNRNFRLFLRYLRFIFQYKEFI